MPGNLTVNSCESADDSERVGHVQMFSGGRVSDIQVDSDEQMMFKEKIMQIAE